MGLILDKLVEIYIISRLSNVIDTVYVFAPRYIFAFKSIVASFVSLQSDVTL